MSKDGSTYVGGLVGRNGNTNSSNSPGISNSYATGSVQGWAYVGGLVGGSFIVNSISNSYSTGSVSGVTAVGGLVGYSQYYYPFTANNSYWNTTTSGQTSSAGGGTGLTSAQMLNASNFTGFGFIAAPGEQGWVMFNADGTFQSADSKTAGATFPMLTSENSPVIFHVHQLQMMKVSLATRYTLVNDIDATATGSGGDVWGSTGFVPVSTFTGSFDGQGHIIRNLTINQPNTNMNVGLFGNAGTGASISNVGLVGASVSGGDSTGGLVGYLNASALSNCYVMGSVNGGDNTGGLVGNNLANGVSSIVSSYAMGMVKGKDNVGGLVGFNGGGSGKGAASISSSFAAASVTGVGSQVGGLVGYNLGENGDTATISNSYATGSVSGFSNVGGLLGQNQVLGTGKASVTNSYAAGSMNGSSSVGGLVGLSGGGAVSGGYWNTETSGQTTSAGSEQGLNDVQMRTTGSLLGFSFGSNSGTVGNSQSSGNVSGVGGFIGGLIGSNSGTYSNCTATGNVSGDGGFTGALIGVNK